MLTLMKGDEVVETVKELCDLSLFPARRQSEFVFEHGADVQRFITPGTTWRGQPKVAPKVFVQSCVTKETWLHVVMEAELRKTV